MAIRGLWSVCRVKILPCKYRWNFVTANIIGWLFLRLLKSASCFFCHSRKNRCCFSSFFLKILSSFSFRNWRSFSTFLFNFFFLLLSLHLELHHLSKHFFKVFHLKKYFDTKKSFFFSGGEYFSSVNIPRNQE